MKVKALKDLNWSVNRIATKYMEGEVFDVVDSVAKSMIESKSAIKFNGKEKAVENKKENKATEFVAEKQKEEPKEEHEKRRPGRPRKPDFSPHVPLKGQVKLGL